MTKRVLQIQCNKNLTYLLFGFTLNDLYLWNERIGWIFQMGFGHWRIKFTSKDRDAVGSVF